MKEPREFSCFVSTFPHPVGAAVVIWSCFSKLLYFKIFFLNFPGFFWLFLPQWCCLKVHFVFQHSSFFSPAVPVLLFVVFFKHNPAAEAALHPTSCSDVKLLIRQPRHGILRRKIRIISTSGDLCPYVQHFWNPPSIPSAPSLLASGKAKHLHCTCLCAHQSAPAVRSCVSGVAEFIILFCSFSLLRCKTREK